MRTSIGFKKSVGGLSLNTYQFFVVVIFVVIMNLSTYAQDNDNQYIWIEAEDADIKSGWNTPDSNEITGASGSNPGWNCLGFYYSGVDPAGLDKAIWKNIEIIKPGNYHLWVRMKNVSRTMGRFTIGWNNQTIFENLLVSNVNITEFTWLSIGELQDLSGIGSLSFQRGNMMCWMSYLDCILLTTDASYTPSGITQPSGAIEHWQSSWIKDEKVKATYTWAPISFHSDPSVVTGDLSDAGFNSIILKGLETEYPDGQAPDWFAAADTDQIRLFDCYNFFSSTYQNMESYRKAVYQNGTTSLAPCPLDESYWDDRVIPAQIDLAELSLTEPSIVGMMMDTEMYGIQPHAYLEDVCFCDDCFLKFLQSISLDSLFSQISVSGRYGWLNTNGYLEDYYGLLEERLALITAKFRDEIHAINPALYLGNLNYVDTWFFRGLAKGWGTNRMPAIVAPETPTYTLGYHSFVNDEVSRFQSEGFRVYYIPGIWNIRFFPDELSRHCYNLSANADGYFDFTVRALYSGLIPDFYAELLYKSGNDIQAYWDTFTFANKEICKKQDPCAYENEIVNIAEGKSIILVDSLSSGTASSLTDGSSDFTSTVTWDVTNKEYVSVIVDLGSVQSVRRVKMFFQGGGLLGGTYFPLYIRAYGSETLLDSSSTQWDSPFDSTFVGETIGPDDPFAFAENGLHSAPGYRKGMTVDTKKAISARYVKIVIYKQPDSYAASVTQIGETVHKLITADEIEIVAEHVSVLETPEANLAGGQNVALVDSPVSGTGSNLTDGDTDFSNTVTWDVTNKEKISVIVDMGTQQTFKRIRMSFQGGGLLGGIYFPASMEIYGSSVSLSASDPLWDSPSDSTYFGTVARPDNPFPFVENGWHSATAYQERLTCIATSMTARYIKLVIYKQPDSYAQSVTQIGETVHKKIVADEIEINE